MNFYRDMGPSPGPGYSIEREDNDRDYGPNNPCRWATTREQARNKRNNVWFEHDGKRMILSDWPKELKVSRGFIENRLAKNISFTEIVRQAKEYRLAKHWHEDLLENAA